MSNLFEWKHYQSEIITFCVHWYLKYPFSCRNISDMMAERGLTIIKAALLQECETAQQTTTEGEVK